MNDQDDGRVDGDGDAGRAGGGRRAGWLSLSLYRPSVSLPSLTTSSKPSARFSPLDPQTCSSCLQTESSSVASSLPGARRPTHLPRTRDPGDHRGRASGEPGAGNHGLGPPWTRSPRPHGRGGKYVSGQGENGPCGEGLATCGYRFPPRPERGGGPVWRPDDGSHHPRFIVSDRGWPNTRTDHYTPRTNATGPRFLRPERPYGYSVASGAG